MYKLVVSDLDGTLLNSKHEVSNASKYVIEDLEKEDILFTMATGRICSFVSNYAKKLGVKTPVIASNGAVIYDIENKSILHDTPIGKELCYKIIEIFKKYDIYFHLYTLETVYGERKENLVKDYYEWISEHGSETGVKVEIVKDVKDIIDADIKVYNFGFYDENENTHKVFEALKKIKELEVYFSTDVLVDVMNVKASKGNGVAKLSEILNIPMKDVVALGDNENDIDMIKRVGLGIVMGNGLPHVKSNADYVTDSNEDEGLSKAIRKMVLKQI